MALTINLTDALDEDKIMIKEWANSEEDTHTQSITGKKTFGLSPSLPTPTNSLDGVNKSYVDLYGSTVKWVETEITSAGQIDIVSTHLIANVGVYVNGLLMTLTTDYTEDEYTISLVVPAELNDVITLVGGTNLSMLEHYSASIGNINSPLLDMPLNNSLAMKQGVGSSTFTRASTATYIDIYGILKVAGIDEPRFEKLGYLTETESTNMVLNSETILVGAGVSVTEDIAEAPDAISITADLLQENTEDSEHFGNYGSINSEIDSTYTMSAFVKNYSGTRDIRLRAAGANNASGIFNLSLGTCAISGTATAYKIDVLANGWYRLAVTFLSTVAGSTLYRIQLHNGALAVYLGDSTSGAFVWGAQLEEQNFATSYIPTTVSPVQRDADILSVTHYGNMLNWSDESTILIDISPLGVSSLLNRAVLTTGATWDSGYINHNAGGALAYRVADGDVASSVVAIEPTIQRIACINNGLITRLFIDGTVFGDTGAIGTSIENNSIINIGHRNETSNFCGHISNFRIYDKALSDIEIKMA